MARKPTADIVWPSLHVEGNLLSAAMMASIDRREAGEQSEPDYGVRKGLTIRDEIALAFRVGQAHVDGFAKLVSPSPAATVKFARDFFRETFGFSDLEDDQPPVALSAGNGRIPVVVVPPSDELDRRSPSLSQERARSAVLVLQDQLNASEGSLWGLATNGTTLRLMRDNASLTRPTYVDADLAQIFTTEDMSSFAALWLLIHRSRFGQAGMPPTDCTLERWRDASARAGAAARDQLAGQVEQALRDLGSGFLAANPDLRTRLLVGDPGLTDWFNELLRLVYRLIFLMVAEDRELLHAPDAAIDARRLYAEGFSLAHLRQHAVRRVAWDQHHDRYEALKIVFRGLARGQPQLGLPALGGLFADGQLPTLAAARLPNRALLAAIWRLGWLIRDKAAIPINWRAMETVELGSVYESLLELQPQFTNDGRDLVFATDAAETKGNQRKTTGSYYTPDNLVQTVLDSALDPILDRAESGAADPAESLLALTVIDPACGSGHFLLAAARRIAARLARHRSEGTPSAVDFRHALRDVARRCLHGVDRNPMAVELTKVALWIETVDPGLPLGFFDAQIRCGDSLLGVFDLRVLQNGIPDAAYKPFTADNKETAKHFARRNKSEREGQGSFDFSVGGGSLPAGHQFADLGSKLRALPESTLADIETKARQFDALRAGADWFRWKTACDLYVAAFLAPKTDEVPANRNVATIPTSAHVWEAMAGRTLYGPLVACADILTHSARAFHWPLEFPEIAARGGFDVLVGNPPWDVVQRDERSAADAEDRLKTYFSQDPYSVLNGRRDLYKLFLCRLPDLVRKNGNAALLVPVGFLMEEDCIGLRKKLWNNGSIAKIMHFQNADRCFFDRVHASYRFVIVNFSTATNGFAHWFSATITNPAFIITQDSGVSISGDHLRDYITNGGYGELHNSLELLKMHRRLLALGAFDTKSRYGLTAEWHATTHKKFAVSPDDASAIPVGKNRDIHQYNDNFAAASFFVSKADAISRATEKSATLTDDGHRILIRDIARNDDTVTMIAAPSAIKLSSYDTPAITITRANAKRFSNADVYFLAGYLNSRIADFLIRPFVDKHIKGYVLSRLPVPELDLDSTLKEATVDCVASLIKLGRAAGNKPIWESVEGANLLRRVDQQICKYLGIESDDAERIFSLFPHLYNKR